MKPLILLKKVKHGSKYYYPGGEPLPPVSDRVRQWLIGQGSAIEGDANTPRAARTESTPVATRSRRACCGRR